MATVQLEKIAIEEIADFLVSIPSLEQMANIHPSDELSARVSYLLEMNREGTISKEEVRELDNYTALNHLMSMVKIKARIKLDKAI